MIEHSPPACLFKPSGAILASTAQAQKGHSAAILQNQGQNVVAIGSERTCFRTACSGQQNFTIVDD